MNNQFCLYCGGNGVHTTMCTAPKYSATYTSDNTASDMLALLVRIQKLECEVERLKEKVK